MINATFNMTRKETEKYLKVKPGFFKIEQLTDWVTDSIALNLQKEKFPESEITVNVIDKNPNKIFINISREEAEKYLEIETNLFRSEQITDWVTDKIVLILQEMGFPDSEITVNIIEQKLNQNTKKNNPETA
ncbi:hypothetical protein [Xenorhabdus indica]|uniref:hypothetical protein n=1 Tax=Xenorhabdus indica TaxID=333964 RepID=UPI00165693E3|nr:hypothetical protein [Xenorhabdus indica]MBC8947034.1 hypothetical protein [Xenorhabdus indica]